MQTARQQAEIQVWQALALGDRLCCFLDAQRAFVSSQLPLPQTEILVIAP
ncbi:hypothetical protein JOY44_08695 [Phormidium sp. CLA17]|nr:hypothetical protein [Leptolyngbya sp. Cla-17]MBM0741694.1 hypothetical protein [Leptolyngbya sp. Cla-17]